MSTSPELARAKHPRGRVDEGAQRVGAYLALAGIDGSGKSTQAGYLRKRLADAGYAAYLMEGKEDFVVPTMTSIALRQGYPGPRPLFGDEAVDLVKAFDTLRDYSHMVAPLRSSGMVVVQPRSGYCRVALAEAFGSRNVALVEAVTHFAGEPDLVLWIDVPAEVAVRRIEARGIDSEDPEMLHRFREAMVRLSRRYPWVQIDGTASVDEVREEVWSAVERWIAETRPRLLRRKEG
jgi:dTMP kinase